MRPSAWLDAQYNNRARVPEHARIFARWAADSARVRSRLSCRLDVAYGDSPGQTLDVFPTARAGAPVLLFIHGGWWRSLDKRDHSFVATAFVDSGALVVMPNYDLCPAVGIDAIALQMTRALAWTHRHAALYGGDSRRIVVAGHSAGGHLAALLLGAGAGDHLPPLRSALAVSGLYDLEPIRHVSFLKADLRLMPGSARRLSPVQLPPPQQGGTLLAVAGARESEEFHRQTDAIRAAWSPEIVPPCEPVAAADHFTVLDDLADPHGRLHAMAWQLLCA